MAILDTHLILRCNEYDVQHNPDHYQFEQYDVKVTFNNSHVILT